MRIFSCACANELFFENTQCVSCGRDVGWCPVCRSITALLPEGDDRLRCGRDECRALLVRRHVPGILAPPVVEKLGFVHDLVCGAARRD